MLEGVGMWVWLYPNISCVDWWSVHCDILVGIVMSKDCDLAWWLWGIGATIAGVSPKCVVGLRSLGGVQGILAV